MDREGRRAVLDDGDGPLAPGHGVADFRCTYDAEYCHRADAGERRLPRFEDRRVGPTFGGAVAVGSPRSTGSCRERASSGDERAAPMYRRSGVRPVERDGVTPVG